MEFKNSGLLMHTAVYLQAKELQMMVGRILHGGCGDEWTDVGEWMDSQTQITDGIDKLIWMQGESHEEEAERILAILMGYTVAVQRGSYIDSILQRAEEVFPYVSDRILKCHLAVFCYGICYDDSLCEEAERLMEEIKRTGRGEEIGMVEELLESMKENSGVTY